MSVTIKSEHELEKMREAGRILGIVHDEMAKIIRPGISTMDINRKGEEVIRSFGCIPSFLNYNGYPASICVSVNDEVVHGIPSKKRTMQKQTDFLLCAIWLVMELEEIFTRNHRCQTLSRLDEV